MFLKVHYESKTDWDEDTARDDDDDASEAVSLGAPSTQSKLAKRRREGAAVSKSPSTDSSSSGAGSPPLPGSPRPGRDTKKPGQQKSQIPVVHQHSQASGGKKARLFAGVNIHSVPEEILLSPHILDFLEQASSFNLVIDKLLELNF